MPTIRIHNIETNQIIDREMNPEELALYEADSARFAAQIQAKQEAAIKRQELLDKLGITEEEAKLLLG